MQAFMNDVSKASGQPVDAAAISLAKPAAAVEPAKHTSVVRRLPESLAQQKSKKFQANKMGFEVGGYVSLKSEKVVSIFKVAAMDDSAAELVLQQDGKDAEAKTVGINDILTNWRVHRGKVTGMLEGWDCNTNLCSPTSSSQWRLDAVKGAVAMAAQKVSKKSSNMLQHIELLVKPTLVKVLQRFEVGELVFVGASARLEQKASKTNILVGEFTVGGALQRMHLGAHFVPPLNAHGEANEKPWVAPFWVVAKAEKPDDINMALKFIEEKVSSDITVWVPILVNNKPLSAGDALSWDSRTAPASVANMVVHAQKRLGTLKRMRVSGKQAGPTTKKARGSYRKKARKA